MYFQRIVSLGLIAALMAFVLTAGCSYYSSDTNPQDIGVVRVDAEGETLWDQTLDSGYGDYLFRMHRLSDVVSVPEGRVFVGYNLRNRPSSDPSMHMGWITCLGPDGEKIWDWSMESEWPAAYAPTLDGGCIVIAELGSGPRIVMIGSDGMTRWGIYASAISFEPTAIASMNSGNYIVGGGSVLTRIDENGTVQDVKNYAGLEAFPGVGTVLPMTDGGCGVVGGPREIPRLARLDADGEILWNATVPYIPSKFCGVRENEVGSLDLLIEEIVNNSVVHGPDGTMHAITYGPEGAVLGEETFAIPPGCPITWATGGGYVVAALMHDEGDLGYFATFDSSSYVHLIKYDETGRQEWDRTVGSEPDMYHVVTINAVGEDGYVVVGERVKERSFFDILAL
ncbi:MAG: hypothetical protein PHQ81_00590 [Methanofollis sp.]|nr:hypothetical protein [Methanofollis sp.]